MGIEDQAPPSFDSMIGAGFVLQPVAKREGLGRFIMSPKAFKNAAEPQGFNPGLTVLLVIAGLLMAFLVGNYVLYTYAQKTLPPKKKKPISKKKMKKERLRQGVSAPGE